MDAMPASWTIRLIYHAFLNRTNLGFFICQGTIAPSRGNSLPTIVVVGKFVSNTHTSKSVIPIRAGMAEPTVVHIPTVQTCAIRQCSVPGKEIQTSDRSIMVDQIK